METARVTQNPTRLLVVEDDPGMRAAVRSFIDVEPDMEIVGEASSGADAIESVRRFAPDVVLLETELPEGNGIALVERYGVDRFPPTIFVIEDERDAADAFRINAVDCIVKPFTHQRFKTTLERVRRHMRRQEGLSQLPRTGSSAISAGSTADGSPARRYPPRLWIRTRGQSRGQVLVVSVDDIEWIEAQARYSCAHTREGDHPLLESISQIEARLDPSRFARVHRSAIVNLDRVAEVVSTRNTRILVLQNGTRVPLSRSRKQHLFQLAGQNG